MSKIAVVVGAAFFTGVCSFAQHMAFGTSESYPFWFIYVAALGSPGLMVAGFCFVFIYGGHAGGGTIDEMLVIAAPINFLVYAAIGFVIRFVWMRRTTFRRKG